MMLRLIFDVQVIIFILPILFLSVSLTLLVYRCLHSYTYGGREGLFALAFAQCKSCALLNGIEIGILLNGMVAEKGHSTS